MHATARACAVALCRAGFEAETAADLRRVAAQARAPIDVQPERDSGYVIARIAACDAGGWRAALASVPPVFARNPTIGLSELALVDEGAPPRPDRLTPLLQALTAIGATKGHRPPWRSVWVEFADTNEGKRLSSLARALQSRLASALSHDGRIDTRAKLRLHVFIPDGMRAYVGTSDASATRWPLGIPRLSRSPAAPSRSSQKLVEALVVFLGDRERELLRAGQRAVDLGAAPGGWSWVLAKRGLRVTAVDNGPLKGEVAQDPLVTHVRADGLRWRPARRVDWLTCDIVEQPARIADVVAGWIADRVARQAIFNLKLPMKKRYDELLRCEELIARRLARSAVRATLAFRHLYHDREEVTGYFAHID